MLVKRIDPTNDFVFQRLLGSLGSERLLVNFLNDILQLQGRKRIVAATILNPVSPPQFKGDKYGILDIKVKDQLGCIYQVEMQTRCPSPLRLVHNFATITASALVSGLPWDDLPRTNAVWILTRNFYQERKTQAAYIRFLMFSPEVQTSLSPYHGVHLLQLKNLEKDDTLTEGQRKWMRFFRDGKNLDLNNLPTWITEDEVMSEAASILRTIATDIKTFMIYDSREKLRRDHETPQILLRRERKAKQAMRKAKDNAEAESLAAKQRCKTAEQERLAADERCKTAEQELLEERAARLALEAELKRLREEISPDQSD